MESVGFGFLPDELFLQHRGRLFGLGPEFAEMVGFLRQRGQAFGHVLAPGAGIRQRMLDARRLREGLDDVGLAVLDLRFVSLRGRLQRVERAFPVAEGRFSLILAFGHLPAQRFALGDLPLPFVLPCTQRCVFFFRGLAPRLELSLLLGQEFSLLPGLLKRMLDPVDVRFQFMQDGLRRRGTVRSGRAFGLQRPGLLVEARAVALERHPPLLQPAYLFAQGRVRPT